MNKTVTINISGIVFHIEEDAYDRLKFYLDSLRRKFNAEEGRDEILADIESRIAEILTGKKGPSREVVVMKDVEEVIAMMGEPDVISDETSNSEPAGANAGASSTAANEHEENYQRKKRRRLFRDPDDRVIGGVCSGLGHYFDIDAVWIRLGFALLFFLGGSGVLFYLLLIIIVPRAETTAEKLEMRGEPVDVNNIRRSIKEEFEEFGTRMKDFGKEAKDWGKSGYDNNRHRSRYHRRGAEDLFRGIFHVMGRVFAFCLVFFGIIMLIGLLTSTFTITDFGPDMVTEQVKSLFDDGTSYGVAIAAGLLFFGVPVLMMIYYGIKLLFRIQRKDKWVGISALSFWILGIVMSVFSIMNIAAGFSEGSDTAERIAVINPHSDTLSIRVSIDKDMENEDYHSGWNRRYRYEHRWKMIRPAEYCSRNRRQCRTGDVQKSTGPFETGSAGTCAFNQLHDCAGFQRIYISLRVHDWQRPGVESTGSGHGTAHTCGNRDLSSRHQSRPAV